MRRRMVEGKDYEAVGPADGPSIPPIVFKNTATITFNDRDYVIAAGDTFQITVDWEI